MYQVLVVTDRKYVYLAPILSREDAIFWINRIKAMGGQAIAVPAE